MRTPLLLFATALTLSLKFAATAQGYNPAWLGPPRTREQLTLYLNQGVDAFLKAENEAQQPSLKPKIIQALKTKRQIEIQLKRTEKELEDLSLQREDFFANLDPKVLSLAIENSEALQSRVLSDFVSALHQVAQELEQLHDLPKHPWFTDSLASQLSQNLFDKVEADVREEQQDHEAAKKLLASVVAKLEAPVGAEGVTRAEKILNYFFVTQTHSPESAVVTALSLSDAKENSRSLRPLIESLYRALQLNRLLGELGVKLESPDTLDWLKSETLLRITQQTLEHPLLKKTTELDPSIAFEALAQYFSSLPQSEAVASALQSRKTQLIRNQILIEVQFSRVVRSLVSQLAPLVEGTDNNLRIQQLDWGYPVALARFREAYREEVEKDLLLEFSLEK